MRPHRKVWAQSSTELKCDGKKYLIKRRAPEGASEQGGMSLGWRKGARAEEVARESVRRLSQNPGGNRPVEVRSMAVVS